MKFFIPLLIFMLSCTNAGAQDPPSLQKWSYVKCATGGRPPMPLTRISAVWVNSNALHMSLEFPYNCCMGLDPGIRFSKDTLWVKSCGDKCPYQPCGCKCGFTMDLVISNIVDTSFTTMFNGKLIRYSEEEFETQAPTFVIYKGDTINRTNKHGLKYGLWILDYAHGKRKSEELYKFVLRPGRDSSIWKKTYYEHGVMSSHIRNDTIEYWHDNGQLKERETIRPDSDDKIKTTIKYFESGALEEKKILRLYSYQHQWEDSCRGAHSDSVEHWETYYESGKLMYRNMGDSSLQWYESGAVYMRGYKGATYELYENGDTMKVAKVWKFREANGNYCLFNMLEVEYFPNGKFSRIYLMRDELDGVGISPLLRYEWTWDENGTTIKKPENWKGELPRFPRK